MAEERRQICAGRRAVQEFSAGPQSAGLSGSADRVPQPVAIASSRSRRSHFGGSKPLVRQRCAIAADVNAVMKARAAATSVLLAGIAAA